MKIKKGQLIILSEGEYSDYHILDSFKAVRDFDTNDVLNSFCELHPEGRTALDSRYNESLMDNFEQFLLDEGYVEELETTEWVISHYGKPLIWDDEGNDYKEMEGDESA